MKIKTALNTHSWVFSYHWGHWGQYFFWEFRGFNKLWGVYIEQLKTPTFVRVVLVFLDSRVFYLTAFRPTKWHSAFLHQHCIQHGDSFETKIYVGEKKCLLLLVYDLSIYKTLLTALHTKHKWVINVSNSLKYIYQRF